MSATGLYFEDFMPEKKFVTAKRTITETDLVNFVTLCGFFEPLFTDQPFAESETPFGARIAPGALSLAYAEGLSILSGIIHRTGMAFLGLELQIHKPVFIGDTIGVEIEVLEKRASQSRIGGLSHFVIGSAIKRMSWSWNTRSSG